MKSVQSKKQFKELEARITENGQAWLQRSLRCTSGWLERPFMIKGTCETGKKMLITVAGDIYVDIQGSWYKPKDSENREFTSITRESAFREISGHKLKNKLVYYLDNQTQN